jgi:hypothetical protein
VIERTGLAGSGRATFFLNAYSTSIGAAANLRLGRGGRYQQHNRKEYGKQAFHAGKIAWQKKTTGHSSSASECVINKTLSHRLTFAANLKSNNACEQTTNNQQPTQDSPARLRWP